MIINKWFRVCILSLAGFLFVTTSWVISYKFTNVPYTMLMINRALCKNYKFSLYNLRKSWTCYEEISRPIKLAVLMGEDFYFFSHNGFDLKAMKESFKASLEGVQLISSSTITQQLAKNLFLWPKKSYFRKALELYFAILLEFFLSKERIFEIYLNSIEWGQGIFGIKKACQHYFKKLPHEIYFDEACILSGLMPYAQFIKQSPSESRHSEHRAECLFKSGLFMAQQEAPGMVQHVTAQMLMCRPEKARHIRTKKN